MILHLLESTCKDFVKFLIFTYFVLGLKVGIVLAHTQCVLHMLAHIE